MSEAIVLAGAKLAIKKITAILDYEMSRALDAEITAHVLSEIPRLLSLLQERIHEIDAAKCSPEEVQIIVYQAIDEQRRTLDGDKRRRLTNVLINGLTAEERDLAEHRLLLRATGELEEEHIDILARWNAAPTLPPEQANLYPPPEHLLRASEVRQALIRELVRLGMLTQKTSTEQKRGMRKAGERSGQVELTTTTQLSRLGARFLKFLRDPETVRDPAERGSRV